MPTVFKPAFACNSTKHNSVRIAAVNAKKTSLLHCSARSMSLCSTVQYKVHNTFCAVLTYDHCIFIFPDVRLVGLAHFVTSACAIPAASTAPVTGPGSASAKKAGADYSATRI